ncbi:MULTISPECIES: HdeD family acid-resistance protein [Rhizobium]|nr:MULTISPECIES: HdeD family acid-resistance protein [Rhizobium]
MSTITANAGIGKGIKHVEENWGWFVALGVGLLIAGGIASANLFLSTLASIIYIAAMMLAGGVMQVLHGFLSHGWKRRAIYVLGGILYAVASAFIISDPVLSAVGISFVIGVLLVATGVLRSLAGLRDRSRTGWGWLVASGILTLGVGVVILATWPAVGLGLLGAMLTVDLIFQGWSYVAFGLALRARLNGGE